MVLTKTQRKALELIETGVVVRPAQFGRLMWPDVPRQLGRCGYGVTRGTGMNLMAGGYLEKLRKKKWIGGAF